MSSGLSEPAMSASARHINRSSNSDLNRNGRASVRVDRSSFDPARSDPRASVRSERPLPSLDQLNRNNRASARSEKTTDAPIKRSDRASTKSDRVNGVKVDRLPAERSKSDSASIALRTDTEKMLKDRRHQLQRMDASDTDLFNDVDSEGSDETSSVDSQPCDSTSLDQFPTRQERKKHVKHQKSYTEWEIMEGLKDGQKCEAKPLRHDGYMLKRRKWPMKGWHKRYFVLESGVLTYAKSPSDILKGRLHGSIDIGLSVIAFKKAGRRIDIDAEELIYHIKVKNTALFEEWVQKLKHHRLYRQHEIAFGTKDAPKLTDIQSPVDDQLPPFPPVPETVRGELARTFSLTRDTRSTSFKTMRSGSFVGTGTGGRVTAWLLDSAGIQRCNKDLSSAQTKIFELTQLYEQLQSFPPTTVNSDQSSELSDNSSPRKDSKDRGARKISSFKKGIKRDKKTSQIDPHTRISILKGLFSHRLPASFPDNSVLHISSSTSNLLSYDADAKNRPASMSDYTSLLNRSSQDLRSQENGFREEFLSVAKDVQETLKSLVRTLSTERERLKGLLEQESMPNFQGNAAYVYSLKTALSDTLKQNQELRSRLNKIHSDSNISDIPPPPSPPGTMPSDMDMPHPLLRHSFSAESTSMSEFFDAAESLQSIESMESSPSTSDEENTDDEISEESEDFDTEYTPVQLENDFLGGMNSTGRRAQLPAPKPDIGDFSLWSLLRKNIGKDLSKISMPVTLNEPINMLQKVCEELEYSELLDKAAECNDPFERMVQVAAFSVSGYAASFTRAGQKPFNPVLGETYENIREDKGWRFISEQVSHHPPISACHCDSKNFVFWQDMRIKNKFWGKSMEIQPIGTVHLVLPKFKDHYTWNKITTCVHNIFSNQRYVDCYGETVIRNGDIICKLTFNKASYWSSKRHEVHGVIMNGEGKVVHHLFGKWTEGIYCGQASSAKCIWRPGSLPEDHDLFYGFTRFAIELNELDRDHAHMLPPTDTRFRPDQRLLEEGKVQEAEADKLRVEQLQRENRKRREEEKIDIEPRWFRRAQKGGRDEYEYKGSYWEHRKNPAFAKMVFPKLW
ncbi:oxysterol-binding protein-related protein 6-like isoform X3 [Lineus longissimus]|uniref:oxysterol-binding protein-related protein 6-like isoform X3 n=1 Tax=Lineus longissimus TaxID=88925 RepID=UPI00315DA4CC